MQALMVISQRAQRVLPANTKMPRVSPRVKPALPVSIPPQGQLLVLDVLPANIQKQKRRHLKPHALTAQLANTLRQQAPLSALSVLLANTALQFSQNRKTIA